MPTCLSTPGTVLLRNHNGQSKYDPLVEEVDANVKFAHVKFGNGRESTVSLQDLGGDDMQVEPHDAIGALKDKS